MTKQTKALSDGGAGVAEVNQQRSRSGAAASAAMTKAPVDLSSVAFDPNATELLRSWSSHAPHVVCLNAYPNGVTLSHHTNDEIRVGEEGENRFGKYLPSQFHLRSPEMRDYLLPSGKYFLYKDSFAEALEQRLAALRDQKVLSSSVVYFGTVNDPFASFHKKFNVTMACLELLEHYKPGLVVVQTRNPMVISALPTLKALGESAVVAMPIETHRENMLMRYTPGQPRIADRLVAADGLRRQGIPVNLVVSPILPYGDVYRDAWDFADVLDRHADYVTFGCLACGKPSDEAQLRALPIAKRLAADKQYRWLRPHAYRHLYFALKVLAPEKLALPLKVKHQPAQLSLFAA